MPKAASHLWEIPSSLVQLDFRSLAIFRMALGILVFSQSVSLWCDFDAFYGVNGISSTSEINHDVLRILLFGVLPFFSVLLVLGLATKFSNLICFVGLILIQDANDQILQGGDVLLRLLLFWSHFLPLSQIWSIDAWRIKEPKPLLPRTTILASWALTLQICFIYWFAAFLKFDPSWIQSGNALFYALNIEHFTTLLGLYLRQFPDLLRFISWGTPCLELLGPCLLLIPFHRDACRLIAVCFFLSFHLIGMQALLRIGLFPQACAAAWLVFTPGSFWNWLGARDRISTKNQSTKQRSGKKLKTKPSIASIADWACVCVLVVAFLDVFAWNIASVSGESSRRWMAKHDFLASAVRLDQRWNMYAPHPRKDHGWLVVPADLANGTQVDLFTDQPISWEKPKDIGALFGDDRWRRYLSNLFDEQNPETLQYYADYLVRNWNERHGEGQKVEAVTITFMKQQTLPDLSVTDPEKDVLYFHAY